MTTIYVTSLSQRAGSTAVAASLAALKASQGGTAGYFKPVTLNDGASDGDAAFVKDALALSESLAQIAPHTATADALAGGLGAAREAIAQAWSQVKSGKDAIAVDGLPAAGDLGTASAELADLVDGKVVGVVRYQRGMDAGEAQALKERFGDRLAGVILNGVPSLSQRAAREETIPALEHAGVRVLGAIPEDRLLLGFTVRDMSQRLGGTIQNSADRSEEIIEHLLVGANVLDSTQFYYERFDNKALITRADRPDLQWNAIDEHTRCLILTGGATPIAYVVDKATHAEVPVVTVPRDTLETIDDIEGFISTPTFHHPRKLERFTELLREHVDVVALGW